MATIAEAKPLPEVEQYEYDSDNEHMTPELFGTVELVLASTFDAHTTALKEQLATARGLNHAESEAHKITAQKCAALKEAVRVLRGALQNIADKERFDEDGIWYRLACTEDMAEHASKALADTAQWEK